MTRIRLRLASRSTVDRRERNRLVGCCLCSSEVNLVFLFRSMTSIICANCNLMNSNLIVNKYFKKDHMSPMVHFSPLFNHSLILKIMAWGIPKKEKPASNRQVLTYLKRGKLAWLS